MRCPPADDRRLRLSNDARAAAIRLQSLSIPRVLKAADRIRTGDLRFTKAAEKTQNDCRSNELRSNPEIGATPDPQLEAVIAAWPTLPAAIRRAMLALIE